MEETSVKQSVAELTGRFKGHALPMPIIEKREPFTRSPPCSLKLNSQTDGESEQEKPAVPSKPKLKSSPLIEKLQANLALTPTPLLNSPKNTEGKLQSTPLCPISPCGPISHTLRPPQQHSEDEVPVSFEQPAEGTPLPSINKSRVRLSFKRRLPTRQHRKSACEETVSDGQDGSTSPCALHSPEKNGEVSSAPQEETEEDLEDSAYTVIDQNTQPQKEQSGDESQDNGDTEVIQGELGGEVAESTDIPQVTDPMEILVEEKPSEEQSPDGMEGVEEECELRPTKNSERKEQLV